MNAWYTIRPWDCFTWNHMKLTTNKTERKPTIPSTAMSSECSILGKNLLFGRWMILPNTTSTVTTLRLWVIFYCIQEVLIFLAAYYSVSSLAYYNTVNGFEHPQRAHWNASCRMGCKLRQVSAAMNLESIYKDVTQNTGKQVAHLTSNLVRNMHSYKLVYYVRASSVHGQYRL